jgi:GWxTD domain-containing protein
MAKHMAKAVYILVGLGLMTTVSMAAVSDQTGFRSESDFGEMRFAIDAVDFRAADSGSVELDVCYKFFYDALSYQKTADGYQADYELAIVVNGNDDKQIEGQIKEGNIKVATYGETQRGSDFIINLIKFTVPGQDLTVLATLTDKLTGTTFEQKVSLDNRKYWTDYPALASILFAREILPPDESSKFNRAPGRVIPRVNRLFRSESDSLISFYQEVYPGKGDEDYTSRVTRIYHRTKGFVFADTVKYGKLSQTLLEMQSIDISGLAPGDYELEVRIEGRRGKLYSKIVEPIEIELTAESAFRNDYKTAVEMLKYLATHDEMKKFEKAKTPEERREIWNTFWKQRNADTRTVEHPTQEEYFRRIRHANRYFSVMKREGWKTTRGMIYISYGQPDEIDDHPFELAEKPYQTWMYYKLNPPRTFLFIDEWGDGNYELQPPYDGRN